MQSECGKIRTKITPNTATFHSVREMVNIGLTWFQYYVVVVVYLCHLFIFRNAFWENVTYTFISIDK